MGRRRGGYRLRVIRASGQSLSSFLSFKTELSGKPDSGVRIRYCKFTSFRHFKGIRKGMVLRNGCSPRWKEEDILISLGMVPGIVLESEVVVGGQCSVSVG